MTELVADRELVLIQTGVAHHYWFLIKRFGRAAPGLGGTVDALAPDAVTRSAIRVEQVADVDLVLPGGAAREATRYDIRIGDTAHVVWVERATGHILRAEIPERAWVAVRVYEPTGSDTGSGAAGSSQEGAR